METTVKQRLIEYLKEKKIGQNRFEKEAGLSIGYINKLRREPSITKLRCILHAAPDLNEQWLLTGEGSMLLEGDVTLVELPDSETATLYKKNSVGIRFLKQGEQLMMEVPLVPYNALGSPEDEYAALLSDREGGEVKLYPVDKVYHGKYFAFEVDGDSMDDGTRRSFGRGDTVLVRELDRDDWQPRLHLKEWPYWVVCWGNCVRLKEITKQEGDIITLHSLNPSPEYTDFTLDLNHVYRLFNVVQVQPKIKVWK